MLDVLEARTFLSGNVQVQVDSVTQRVTITGDGAANQIVVTNQNIGGVTGLRVTGLKGTTVNGGALARVIESGGVQIDLGAGADNLAVQQFQTGRLSIELGAGDDVLTLTHDFIRSNCDIYGSAGNDTIGATSTTFNSHLRIIPGNGADRTGLRKVRTREGFEISDAGSHAEIGLVQVVDTLDSHIPRSYIGTSGGNDVIHITNSTFTQIGIFLRGGNDAASVLNSTFETSHPIDGGTGDNSIVEQ